jgi:peptidyl-dipeptidase A
LNEMYIGSKQAQGNPPAEQAFLAFLDKLEHQLEEVDRACADAQWRKFFGRMNKDELSRLEATRSTLLLKDCARATLNRWRSRLHTSSLERRVELLSRRLRWAGVESRPEIYQLRNRIDHAIVAFLPRINGVPFSRADRIAILRRHPDRARRREAWLAMAPLAVQNEAQVRELMRRRQRLARELGYASFVSWALDTIGLSRKWVEDLFDELRRLTEAPYRAWLTEAARGLALRDGLRPWDLAFAAEQLGLLPDAAFPAHGLLQAVQAVADGLGLSEEAAGVRVDVVRIPYSGLCYAVHPPDDVRILLNPRDGHIYYGTLFHEFGHAVHYRCMRPMSPVLRWESPPFNEAMACIWERLVWEKDWLTIHGGITSTQFMSCRQLWIGRMLYRLRALLAQATFEYRAYEDLDGNLLALLRDTYAEHLCVPYDQTPGWADGPFWTSHPVYLQNYVIAEVVASQTIAALRQQFGRLIGEPRVGTWLRRNYYAPGASLSWATKVDQATGAPLDSASLIADLTHHG